MKSAVLPDVATGLRAAVATLPPFFLAAALGRPELAWMALGGWLGTLADPGGSRESRARALGAFAISGALVIGVAETSASSQRLATIVLAAVVFVATMLRATGGTGSAIGTVLAVTAAIGTSTPAAHGVVRDGLLFAAGAGWATLLSTVVWPVWTHLPLRRALSPAYEALGAYASALAVAARDKESGDPVWSSLAREHQRAARAAIEATRAITLEMRSRRSGETPHGSDLRVLTGLAEEQLLALVALAEEIEHEAGGIRTRAFATLERLATEHATTARHLAAPIRARSKAIPAGEPPRTSRPPPDSHAEALMRRLEEGAANAARLAGALGASTQVTEAGDDAPERQAFLADVKDDLVALADALSLASPHLRHAMRVTAATVVASILGHALSSHPQWVTITTIAILQPYPGPTVTRALERMVGTVLGSVVAAIITTTVHAPLALAAVMFPLSIAAVATRPRSYRLFTFFLTPVFVLLAEHHPGDWWTAAARSGDALVGGLVALAASLVVLPSWEQTRLPAALDAMVDAARGYADVVLPSLSAPRSESTAEAVAAARRTLAVALGEAETSLERMLAEPRTKTGRRASVAVDAVLLVSYGRRFAGALTALDARRAATPDAILPREDAQELTRFIDDALTGGVADDLRSPTIAVGQSGDRTGEPAPSTDVRRLLDRLVAHTILVTRAHRPSGRGDVNSKT